MICLNSPVVGLNLEPPKGWNNVEKTAFIVMYTVVRKNNILDVYFSINLQFTKQFEKPVPEGVEPKQGATTITDYHI